jgi:hypothetical protein
MESLQDIVRNILTASVFGGIVFFASVVAPVVFKVLDGDDASRFLRTLFPRYYLFLIITAGLAALFSWGEPLQALGLGFISLSTLFVRQVAVPRINAWRDAEMDGDMAAGKKFKAGHRGTVVLNLVQLVIAAAVLVLIAG